MHELSIVEGVLAAVRQELAARPEAGRVSRVHLRVGALRQVEPATLQFGFQQAVRDTELAGAELALELEPARARCQACRREFTVTEWWFACPHCESPTVEVVSGKELLLTAIECEQLQPVSP